MVLHSARLLDDLLVFASEFPLLEILRMEFHLGLVMVPWYLLVRLYSYLVALALLGKVECFE